MKRIVAIISAFVLLCSNIVFAQQTNTVTYKKNNDSQALLEKIGVWSVNRTVLPEDNVTRGEFAEFALRLEGYDIDTINGYNIGSVYFNDINDSAYVKSILLSYEVGIMEGYEDNTFRPNEAISVTEAATAVLRILGYKQALDGGYVTVMKAASSAGLLKGIGITGVVTYSDLAQILYNALFAEVMVADIGSGKAEYTKSDENLLSYLFGIKEIVGVVSANRFTELDFQSNYQETRFEIDGNEYISNGDYDEYLGYRVKAYYYEENDEIVFVTPYNTTVTQIPADLISDTTTEKRIVYTENDDAAKEKYENINGKISVIYNGVAAGHYTEDMLKPINGSVCLINNDNDDDIDVIEVNEYCNYFVQSTDLENEIIYDYYGKDALELDEKHYTIKKSGEKIAFSDICVNDVLAVFAGEGDNVNIIVSDVVAAKNAKVVGMTSENDKKFVSLDNGQTYTIEQGYLNTVSTSSRASELKMGISGDFYFDYEGRIAAFRLGVNELRYGYLKRVIEQDEEDTLSIKLFDQSGEWRVLNLAQNAKLYTMTDEYKKLKIADFKASLGETADGSVKPQLIMYKIDENNKITKLYVANSDPIDPLAQKDYQFVYNYVGTKNTYYYSDQGLYSYRYYVDSAPIFSISDAAEVSAEFDDDDIFIVKSNRLGSDNVLKIYNANIGNIAGAAVCLGGETSAKIDSNNRFMVITDIQTVLYKDDAALCVNGISRGAELTLYIKDNTVGKNLENGDIIQYNVEANDSSCIQYLQIIYKNKNREDVGKYDPKTVYKNTYVKRILSYIPNGFESIYTAQSADSGLVHGFVYNLQQNKYMTIIFDKDQMDTSKDSVDYNGKISRTFNYSGTIPVYRIRYQHKNIKVESISADNLRVSANYDSKNGSEVIVHYGNSFEVIEIYEIVRD